MTTTRQLPGALLLTALVAVALTCIAMAAPRADAFIYWTDLGGFGSGEIGRANNDYTDFDRKFIRGGIGPDGIAVDSKHVYWLNFDGRSIGRARLDGRKVDQNFVEGTGVSMDIDVDGDYIYWSKIISDDAGIGRARIDGTQVEPDFIQFDDVDFTTPAGIDVANGFIYWANAYPEYTIGRAAVDGSDLNQRFIDVPDLRNPFGLAVTDTSIYFTNRGRRDIARASIDGSALELEFLPQVGRVSYLAVDDRFLYWPGPRYSLMRARLNGSKVKALSEHRFHGGSIAVDGLGPG
jgi:Domain of unknown function (DUF5050)